MVHCWEFKIRLQRDEETGAAKGSEEDRGGPEEARGGVCEEDKLFSVCVAVQWGMMRGGGPRLITHTPCAA